MKKEKQEDKKLLYAGGIAGIIASLCCIGPVVLVLLGLTSVSTALRIGKFRLLFTALAVFFFGVAIFLYLTKKKCCTTRGLKEHWKLIALSFVIFIAFLILLKYWLAPIIAKIVYA